MDPGIPQPFLVEGVGFSNWVSRLVHLSGSHVQ